MEYIRILNWDKFQQYKDRSPKWIKLHRELLDRYDFNNLPDVSKAQLMLLWMLAAGTDNKIRNNPAWITKRLSLTTKLNLDILISAGFIEVYSDDAASVQNCTDLYRNVQKNTLVEKRREEKRREDIYQAYPKKVDRGEALLQVEKTLKVLSSQGKDADWLLGRVQKYAASPVGSAKDKTYIPSLARWLRRGKYDDDEARWNDTGKEQLASRVPVEDGQYANMGENIDA